MSQELSEGDVNEAAQAYLLEPPSDQRDEHILAALIAGPLYLAFSPGPGETDINLPLMDVPGQPVCVMVGTSPAAVLATGYYPTPVTVRQLLDSLASWAEVEAILVNPEGPSLFLPFARLKALVLSGDDPSPPVG
jgi:hypothetical protein